jgi:hypothetical protein
MKVRRPLLHAARIADEVLFYPALALVIWGELSPARPNAFGLLGAINNNVLYLSSFLLARSPRRQSRAPARWS